MHCVIELRLGREAEEQIRSLWRALAEQGINPREFAPASTPHVTVMSSAPFPLGSVAGELAVVARQFEPFEITFSHFGIFPGKPAVVFLGVTHTAALTTLHRRLFDSVSPKAEVFDFVRPDVFVFHCTLGYVMLPSELLRAVDTALHAELPRTVWVRGFDVVEYGETTRVLESYAFGQSGAGQQASVSNHNPNSESR